MVDTDKKKPLGWVASGSSEAGKAVSEWVTAPESKKEMWGRAGWVAVGGVVGIAMIHDMGFQGVLIDVGAVVGGAAWMHFSPKAKKRSAQENSRGDQTPEKSQGDTSSILEDPRAVPVPMEGASGDWTAERPESVQPVTWENGADVLDDEPTIRLDSPVLSRQGVQSDDDWSHGGASSGVHAGQEAAPVAFTRRPDIGHAANRDDQDERVSGVRTESDTEGDIPSSEAVQELDSAGPDWFIAFIRQHEEIEQSAEVEEAPYIPVLIDPFDASAMVKEQPPLWHDEEESAQVDEHVSVPVPEEPKSYRTMQDQHAEQRRKAQDHVLMENMLNDLSVRDIAEKYNMSPSTVQDWITKAKKRHREELQSFPWPAETPGNADSDES